MIRRRKIVAVAAAAAALVVGGGAIAASQLSPGERSKAVIDDAAKQLGVEPSKLSDALKKAMENQVDADVAAGHITKEQGDALKQRIESSEYPLIGGPGFGGPHGFGFGFGHHGPFGARLDAAATYLGLTVDELHTQLESGKSLADVAKAQDKSVDGLVDALLADAKAKLADAVSAGRLTQAEADEMARGLEARITDLVNGRFPHPPDGMHGFRIAPPPTPQGAAA